MSDVLQCVAVCCSVLQCVAVCCSVLQCVALCLYERYSLITDRNSDQLLSLLQLDTLQHTATHCNKL